MDSLFENVTLGKRYIKLVFCKRNKLPGARDGVFKFMWKLKISNIQSKPYMDIILRNLAVIWWWLCTGLYH